MPYVSGVGDANLKSSVWPSVMAQRQDRFANLMVNKMKCFCSLTNGYEIILYTLSFAIIRFYILLYLGPSNNLEFEKQLDAHCMGTYGNYSSLSEAISACTLDDSCGKVYSSRCDSSGGFQLCSVRSQQRISQINSCLYIKPGKNFAFDDIVYSSFNIV